MAIPYPKMPVNYIHFGHCVAHSIRPERHLSSFFFPSLYLIWMLLVTRNIKFRFAPYWSVSCKGFKVICLLIEGPLPGRENLCPGKLNFGKKNYLNFRESIFYQGLTPQATFSHCFYDTFNFISSLKKAKIPRRFAPNYLFPNPNPSFIPVLKLGTEFLHVRNFPKVNFYGQNYFLPGTKLDYLLPSHLVLTPYWWFTPDTPLSSTFFSSYKTPAPYYMTQLFWEHARVARVITSWIISSNPLQGPNFPFGVNANSQRRGSSYISLMTSRTRMI
jgi:hypothetical protein